MEKCMEHRFDAWNFPRLVEDLRNDILLSAWLQKVNRDFPPIGDPEWHIVHPTQKEILQPLRQKGTRIHIGWEQLQCREKGVGDF